MEGLKTVAMPVNVNSIVDVSGTFLDLLETSYRNLRVLNDKMTSFDNYFKARDKANGNATIIQELGENLLFDLDEITTIDIGAYAFFSQNQVGYRAATRKSLEFFLNQVQPLIDKVNEIYEIFLLPEEEEDIQQLYSALKQSTGSLALFIYYQFGLVNFSSDRINSGNYPTEIYVALDDYCIKYSLEMDKLIMLSDLLGDIIAYCDPKLTLLERFPNLSDSLSDYLDDFILDDTDVSIELIDQLISGEISDEDFIVRVQALQEGSDV